MHLSAKEKRLNVWPNACGLLLRVCGLDDAIWLIRELRSGVNQDQRMLY
jgi:hypothetical protein